MNNDFDDIRVKFEKLCSERNMNVPIFSEEDIRRLPNIFQLIEFLKQEENKILTRDKGWENYSFTKYVQRWT